MRAIPQRPFFKSQTLENKKRRLDPDGDNMKLQQFFGLVEQALEGDTVQLRSYIEQNKKPRWSERRFLSWLVGVGFQHGKNGRRKGSFKSERRKQIHAAAAWICDELARNPGRGSEVSEVKTKRLISASIEQIRATFGPPIIDANSERDASAIRVLLRNKKRIIRPKRGRITI